MGLRQFIGDEDASGLPEAGGFATWRAGDDRVVRLSGVLGKDKAYRRLADIGGSVDRHGFRRAVPRSIVEERRDRTADRRAGLFDESEMAAARHFGVDVVRAGETLEDRQCALACRGRVS